MSETPIPDEAFSEAWKCYSEMLDRGYMPWASLRDAVRAAAPYIARAAVNFELSEVRKGATT